MVVEFGVIVLLFWAFSREYQANAYFQTWVQDNAWPLAWLLNGYAAALLFGVLVAGVASVLIRDDPRLKLRRKRRGEEEQ